MSEVYNLNKSFEVIKFFADHCKSSFCFTEVHEEAAETVKQVSRKIEKRSADAWDTMA